MDSSDSIHFVSYRTTVFLFSRLERGKTSLRTQFCVRPISRLETKETFLLFYFTNDQLFWVVLSMLAAIFLF